MSHGNAVKYHADPTVRARRRRREARVSLYSGPTNEEQSAICNAVDLTSSLFQRRAAAPYRPICTLSYDLAWQLVP